VKDFQAIAMITRGLFELAVDMKLIKQIPVAVLKITTFSEVEKLRAAKMIVTFTTVHQPESVDATVQALFIKNNESTIEAQRKAVWGEKAKVSHWSGMSLRKRAALLKEPFEEMYEVKYPQLSWYTHASGSHGVRSEGVVI
jgi:hypothetical protein